MARSGSGGIRQGIELVGAEAVRQAFERIGSAGASAFQKITSASKSSNFSGLTKDVNSIGGAFGSLRDRAQQGVTPLRSAFSGVAAEAGLLRTNLVTIADRVLPSWRTALAGIGVGAGVTGLALFVKSAAEAADALQEQADSLGLSVERYQAFAQAAQNAGLSNEQFATAFSRFSNQVTEEAQKQVNALGDIGKAIAGNTRLAGAFQPLDDAALQQLQRAAGQIKGLFANAGIDASADQILASLTRLAQGTSETAVKMRADLAKVGVFLPAATVGEALDQLNQTAEQKLGRYVRLVDEAGKKRLPEDVFLDFADSIAALEDPAERSSRVIEVFGARAGARLVPLLQGGRKAIDDVAVALAKAGAAITPRDTKAGNDFADALGEMTTAFTNAKIIFNTPINEALTPLLTTITDSLRNNSEAIRAWGADVAGRMAPAIQDFINLIKDGNKAELRTDFARDAVSIFRSLNELGGFAAASVKRVAAAFRLLVAAVDAVLKPINDALGTNLRADVLLTVAALAKVTGVLSAITGGLKLARVAAVALNATLLKNPLLFGAAAATAGITALLSKDSPKVKEFIDSLTGGGEKVEKAAEGAEKGLLNIGDAAENAAKSASGPLADITGQTAALGKEADKAGKQMQKLQDIKPVTVMRGDQTSQEFAGGGGGSSTTKPESDKRTSSVVKRLDGGRETTDAGKIPVYSYDDAGNVSSVQMVDRPMGKLVEIGPPKFETETSQSFWKEREFHPQFREETDEKTGEVTRKFIGLKDVGEVERTAGKLITIFGNIAKPLKDANLSLEQMKGNWGKVSDVAKKFTTDAGINLDQLAGRWGKVEAAVDKTAEKISDVPTGEKPAAGAAAGTGQRFPETDNAQTLSDFGPTEHQIGAAAAFRKNVQEIGAAYKDATTSAKELGDTMGEMSPPPIGEIIQEDIEGTRIALPESVQKVLDEMAKVPKPQSFEEFVNGFKGAFKRVEENADNSAEQIGDSMAQIPAPEEPGFLESWSKSFNDFFSNLGKDAVDQAKLESFLPVPKLPDESSFLGPIKEAAGKVGDIFKNIPVGSEPEFLGSWGQAVEKFGDDAAQNIDDSMGQLSVPPEPPFLEKWSSAIGDLFKDVKFPSLIGSAQAAPFSGTAPEGESASPDIGGFDTSSLVPDFSGAFSELTSGIDVAKSQLSNLASEVSSAVSSALGSISELISQAAEQLSESVSAQATAISELASAALASLSELVSSTAEQISSGFATAFESLQSAITSVVEGINSSIQSISVSITALIEQINSAATAASSLSGDSGGLPGFATGGYIRGPGTGTSDDIIARVSNGEFVSRTASVNYYSPQFYAALNRMQIPREWFASLFKRFRGYATGGLVNRPVSAGSIARQIAHGIPIPLTQRTISAVRELLSLRSHTSNRVENRSLISSIMRQVAESSFLSSSQRNQLIESISSRTSNRAQTIDSMRLPRFSEGGIVRSIPASMRRAGAAIERVLSPTVLLAEQIRRASEFHSHIDTHSSTENLSSQSRRSSSVLERLVLPKFQTGGLVRNQTTLRSHLMRAVERVVTPRLVANLIPPATQVTSVTSRLALPRFQTGGLVNRISLPQLRLADLAAPQPSAAIRLSQIVQRLSLPRFQTGGLVQAVTTPLLRFADAASRVSVPQFHLGGLVNALSMPLVPQSVPRFASGGLVSAPAASTGAGRTMLPLVLDGRVYPMYADDDIADSFARVARRKQMVGAGRRPGVL